MFLRISINLQSIKQFSLHSFMCFLLLFPLLPPLFRLPLHIYLLTHFSSGPLSTLKRQQIGSVRRGQTVRFVFSDCYLPCHLMYIHSTRTMNTLTFTLIKYLLSESITTTARVTRCCHPLRLVPTMHIKRQID